MQYTVNYKRNNKHGMHSSWPTESIKSENRGGGGVAPHEIVYLIERRGYDTP